MGGGGGGDLYGMSEQLIKYYLQEIIIYSFSIYIPYTDNSNTSLPFINACTVPRLEA